MNRKFFLTQLGLLTLGFKLAPNLNISKFPISKAKESNTIKNILPGEDIFGYIERVNGKFDLSLYRRLLGYCNEYKEGDAITGVAARSDEERRMARQLLSETKLQDIISNSVFEDTQSAYIQRDTRDGDIKNWTFSTLKKYLIKSPEEQIKSILPELHSDQIACVVKIMNNEELIQVSRKIFHPLPGCKIGSKGYMGARVQPNSPTDNPEDIFWQVMNAWSFGVGDVVLGTNPVSSEVESVAKIEQTLHDLLVTFQLENHLPHCVLSHIDIQAQVEEKYPGTTGIWFQSIAGTDAANQTFDVTIEKMQNHASKRKGKYGLYAETGQGADETNGHSEGFDMLIHESRKYGLMRGLKKQIEQQKVNREAWLHVNDVAGFIGPEVFRTKEQLVRCCLEDILMGKLHGLTIGLDICTTLHMDVSLDDLDWCIDQIMPANPAYLMALPTKNDPMLSYLTTSFVDHVRIREKFGYRVNDSMWNFFKVLGVINPDNSPSANFADPSWVYYQYRLKKGDTRNLEEIKAEAQRAMNRVQLRGVPLAIGHGKNIWDLKPELEAEIRTLYNDAKMCIWEEWPTDFAPFSAPTWRLESKSLDRKDYIYHPQSGEALSSDSLSTLRQYGALNKSDYQIVVSDGLNVRALTDEGHLSPFLQHLMKLTKINKINVSADIIQIKNGRVRAGYQCGEILFGGLKDQKPKGIIHLIGERPGSKHRCFSVYITIASCDKWRVPKLVDHDITKVISGISNTSYLPDEAARETIKIMEELILAIN